MMPTWMIYQLAYLLIAALSIYLVALGLSEVIRALKYKNKENK